MANRNQSQYFDPEKPHVIVCEGIDDKNFLNQYLQHLSKVRNLDCNKFNILEMGGVDNLLAGIKIFKNYENYEEMKIFLFIRDADTNAVGAVDSLRDKIDEIWNIKLDRLGNFAEDADGKFFGFFIFPGLDESGKYKEGALEDLCSEIFSPLKVENICPLVDEHLQKVEQITGEKFRALHKNRLHLLFASTDKFVGDKIGEAAKKNAFNFSSEKLKAFKERILQMSNF